MPPSRCRATPFPLSRLREREGPTQWEGEGHSGAGTAALSRLAPSPHPDPLPHAGEGVGHPLGPCTAPLRSVAPGHGGDLPSRRRRRTHPIPAAIQAP